MSIDSIIMRYLQAKAAEAAGVAEPEAAGAAEPEAAGAAEVSKHQAAQPPQPQAARATETSSGVSRRNLTLVLRVGAEEGEVLDFGIGREFSEEFEDGGVLGARLEVEGEEELEVHAGNRARF